MQAIDLQSEVKFSKTQSMKNNVRVLTCQEFVLDETIRRIGGSVELINTPNFKFPGLAIKHASNLQQKMYLQREAAILHYLQDYMRVGKFRVPGMVLYDEHRSILVIQRIYGCHALDALKLGQLKMGCYLDDVVRFLSKINRGKLQYINLCDSIVYKKFLMRLRGNNCEPHGIYKKMAVLLAQWGDVSFPCRIGLITGDFSPIHMYYSDNKIYGIDFNAAGIGSMTEEIGLFLGNLFYHLFKQDLDIGDARIEFFLSKSDIKSDFQFVINPFLAYSYFLKSLLAEGDIKSRLIKASIRLLRSTKFDVKLLKF